MTWIHSVTVYDPSDECHPWYVRFHNAAKTVGVGGYGLSFARAMNDAATEIRRTHQEQRAASERDSTRPLTPKDRAARVLDQMSRVKDNATGVSEWGSEFRRLLEQTIEDAARRGVDWTEE